MISRQTVETRTDGIDTDYEALPDGWSAARLGDLVDDVQPGFACGSNNRDGLGVGHLRPMNISRGGRIDLSSLKYIPLSEAVGDARWVQCGDVVFNNTNSPELVGKTAYYDSTEPRAFSNHMTRIRCRVDRLEPRYCAVAMHQLWREGYFEAVCKNHVSQASVGRSVLLDAVISLPPLAEQRRIVTHVEALLARVNATRDRLAKVPLVMKRFRQAVLAAAFSGRLTEGARPDMPRAEAGMGAIEPLAAEAFELPEFPERWTVTRVGEAAEFIQYGLSLKADGSREGGLPILRMGNIQDGRLALDDLKYVPHKAVPGNFILARGDMLFNRTNSPELVGKAAVFDADCDATFASYLIRLRCDVRIVVPQFLCFWVNSIWGRAWARSVKTDGVSQSNINAKKLAEMPLPLPSVAEQTEIVRRVQSLFALADAVEKRVGATTVRAEKLTQAVLARAFRGELVPTEAELAGQEQERATQASVLETAPALLERSG